MDDGTESGPEGATPAVAHGNRSYRKMAEGLDPVRVVEAALFSAGKPLALDEISENTGLRAESAREALKALAKAYETRPGALEVSRAGDKWAMQVRAEYAPATARLAPMEIPMRLLKTLALVAYHQPLLQSKLVDMVGTKAYDHVGELKDAGLIVKRVEGNSFILVTTSRFPEYFGIPATDRDGIRRFLAEKMGIVLPKEDGKGNRTLDAVEPASTP